MVIGKSFKAGEGTLEVEMKDDGIELSYYSIDDIKKRFMSIDKLMKLLEYTKIK